MEHISQHTFNIARLMNKFYYMNIILLYHDNYATKISLTMLGTLQEVVGGAIDTHCAKQFAEKFFGNSTHWRNWQKFSADESFHIIIGYKLEKSHPCSACLSINAEQLEVPSPEH